MTVDAYDLSLIAVLGALSLAVVRSTGVRPAVSFMVGIIGVFFLGYVVSSFTHRSPVAWQQVGTPTQNEVEHALALSPAQPLRGVSVRRGDRMSVDTFDVAGLPTLGNHPTLELPADARLQVNGWAADPAAADPCRRLYLLVDARRFVMPYGFARADVATYFKDAAFTMTGYGAQIPASLLGSGKHTISFACLSANGRTLYRSSQSRTVTVE